MVKKIGFTAREVMVGAMILLSVGVAVAVTVPMIDQGSRNNDRRRDMQLIANLITNWQESNQGTLPTYSELSEIEGLKNLKDPDGSTYTYYVNGSSTDATNTATDLKSASTLNHRVYIFYSATCAGNYVISNTSPQSFAVLYKLEGQGNLYCVCN